jgi:hypothetical protein
MSRTALGEFEHHVMLALVRLGGRSRGAPIVLELETATGKTVSPAVRRATPARAARIREIIEARGKARRRRPRKS